MSLSIPHNTKALGSLTFGAEATGPDYRIPMSRATTPRIIEGSWTVDLVQVSIEGTPSPFKIPLNLVTAITLLPDIVVMLPNDIALAIYDYLGAGSSDMVDGGVIPCEPRHTLPDLTLTLSGQAIVLDWKYYTQVYLYGVQRICVVAIQRQVLDTRSAVLGLWLLQRFDITFDTDQHELGRELMLNTRR